MADVPDEVGRLLSRLKRVAGSVAEVADRTGASTFESQGEECLLRFFESTGAGWVAEFSVVVEVMFRPTAAINEYVAENADQAPFATLHVLRVTDHQHVVMVTHRLVAETTQTVDIEATLYSLIDQARRSRRRLEPLLAAALPVAEPAVEAEVEPEVGGSGESLESILADLDKLVGLEPVKAIVHELTEAQRVNQMRKEQGLSPIATNPSLVFVGNPGTGKTTVARVIARLYGALGVVSEGHLVETDRSGLVGEYVGHTAIKTREMCESALGGLLFIDEAYSLSRGGPVDFGAESIDTLVAFMENNRQDFAVIAAGYPAEMAEFLGSNPGVRNRFEQTIMFPDFDNEELLRVFSNYCVANQLVLTNDAVEALGTHIGSLPRGHGFGNARAMRNLFAAVVRRMAVRIGGYENLEVAILSRIEAADIPGPISNDRSHTSPGMYL